MQHPLVTQWGVWQKAQHLSDRTISARQLTVNRLARTCDPDTATAEQIAAFLSDMDVGRWATATYFAHLRAWFRWLNRTGQRDDNPLLKLDAPHPPRCTPRPVTDRELTAILHAANGRRRSRMMVLLAAYQGLRAHEIAKIRGEDVNLSDRLLRVVGKGDSDYELPLHELVAREALRFPRSGWWFPSYLNPGQPLCRQSVSQTVGDAFDRAGVNGGCHRLRHWYATSLLRNGANIRVVQELMRHASIQSTQIYTQVEMAQQRAAIDGLGVAA